MHYKRKHLLSILFGICLLFPNRGIAQSQADNINLVESVSYIRDDNQQLNINNVAENDFTPLKSGILGFNDATFWFKIELKKNDSNTSLVFEFNETVISNLDIYVKKELISSIASQEGIQNPRLREIKLTSKYCYIKIRFKRQVHFDLDVRKLDFEAQNIYFKAFSNGWYYGLVFIIVLVNIFFFFSLKDINFVYYAIFVSSINLALSYYDGTFLSWFGAASPIAHPSVFHFLVALCGPIFMSNFLDLNTLQPKSKTIGISLISISTILYIAYLLTDKYFLLAIGDVSSYLLLSYYWYMGIVLFKKHDYAKYSSIGYSFLLFSGIIFTIPLNIGMHSIGISMDEVKIGAIFEMLVLTYAITVRVKKLHIENVEIQKEINNYIKQLFTLEERLKIESNPDDSITFNNKIMQLKKDFNLTEREVDVLVCVSNEYKNTQIAEELFISVNTVKYHTRNIYQKLNIKNKGDVKKLLI